MSDATIFYICGSALAVMAVVTAFVGLRFEKFPGRFGPLVFLGFAALVIAAATFAVKNGQDEQKARAAENVAAGERFEEQEKTPVSGGEAQEKAEAKVAPAETKAKAKGPGGTVQLEASPTELAFDTKTLTSKPGKVTIDFTNPAPLEHNVAIEENGKVIAQSETLAKGSTSVSAELAPGTYTFLCTIPGHAQAGMEGTLTVK
jgi:plastocyanin